MLIVTYDDVNWKSLGYVCNMDSPSQRIIFNTPQFLARRARALLSESPRSPWFLHDYAIKGNIETIEATKPYFEKAIEVFSGHGKFADELKHCGLLGEGRKIQELEQIEPAFLSEKAPCVSQMEGVQFEKESANLIICNSGLHLVNDLPQLLLNIRSALKKDGLFLASFIGGNSLRELRQTFLDCELKAYGGASLRIAPMIELESAAKLLSKCGFASPVSSVETLKVGYDNVFSLIRDIKAMGENAPLMDKSQKPLNRKLIAQIADKYQTNYPHDNNRVYATFDIINLCGWVN